MAFGKSIRKAINIAASKGIIRAVNKKSKNVKKQNVKKYRSIGISQMRSGRYPTILTSSIGLTSINKKSKKKLLGG